MRDFSPVPTLLRWMMVLLMATPLGAARAQEYEPYLEIVQKDSRFSVDAGDTSLERILKTLGEKAGFRVQDSGATRPKITSFQVEDATLETTLRKLLAKTNHLIVYSADGAKRMEAGRIETIILMGVAERRKTSKSVPASLAGPGGAARNAENDRRTQKKRPPDTLATDDFSEEELDEEEWDEEELVRQLADDPEMLAEFDDDAEQIEADSAVAVPNGPGRPSAILAAEELRRQAQ